MSHNVRPKRVKDLTGLRFGRLVVTEFSHVNRAAYWKCQCSCGNSNVVRSSALVDGKAQSCGCLKFDATKKHGSVNTPEYNSWQNMLQRCTNPNNPKYKDYGGRGIQVYKPWYDFATFLADMGEKPYPSASVERVRNDDNYCPNNCVWGSKAEQSRNTRANVFVIVDGEQVCLADACKLRGVSRTTVHNRMRRNDMTYQQAVDAHDGRAAANQRRVSSEP